MEVLYNSKCHHMKELEQTTTTLKRSFYQFNVLRQVKQVDDLERVSDMKEEVEKKREDLVWHSNWVWLRL